MAMCAREMKKPFYVLTESFKFTRLFPLNQGDLPDEYKVSASGDKESFMECCNSALYMSISQI
jgi:translation initiation factor 2B subunit (eIF-2B alpha/beta/delta family)